MPTLVDKENDPNTINQEGGEQQRDQGFASWRKSIAEDHQCRQAQAPPPPPSVQQQVNNFLGNFPLYNSQPIPQQIMGIQAQNCKAVTKATKQHAARMKRTSKYQISRMNIAASTPFIRKLHCMRCKKVGTPALAKYKKAHHELCPKLTENKKKATTQSNTMRNYVDGSGKVATATHAPPFQSTHAE